MNLLRYAAAVILFPPLVPAFAQTVEPLKLIATIPLPDLHEGDFDHWLRMFLGLRSDAETAPALALSAMKSELNWKGEERYTGRAMTGYAIPGVELRVVDGNDNDVPQDGKAAGEIIARGDGVMQGYWRQPEASAEALRGGWLHTEDLATIDESGYLLIVDRKKDVIVSGGENISSLELEKTISSHPAVLEVGVIPVPDERWGEVPKALVLVKSNMTVTEREIIEFCRSKLAHYKCPRSVEFVVSLPKTATGKILKKELRKKYAVSENTICRDSSSS
jgi:fatty-acyl-CoA synthase